MPTRDVNLTEEQENEAKMTALRAAIQAGLDSGVADPGVFERLYAYIDTLDQEEAEEWQPTALHDSLNPI